MNIPVYSMGLQPAAHGYNCKLCMYYKNYTIIWAVWYTIVILPRAAHEPAHSNGCGQLP